MVPANRVVPRRRRLPVFVLLVLAGSLGAALGLACAERPEEGECYPRDVSLDLEDPQDRLRQTCGWDEGLPVPPDGIEHTWTVSVGFVPTEDEPCDPCDVERIDALLQAKIEERCDQPYSGFTRGCYATPDEAGNQYCWVEAIYFSDCLANEME